jgi:transcriptional regulator with XRE-family HTH domain
MTGRSGRIGARSFWCHAVAVTPMQAGIGPAGDVLRRNLARIRAGKGLSYAELSRRLATGGRALPPLSLARIEAGRRRVDLDDLMSLAVALDVSPVDLLVPGTLTDEQRWQATPAVVLQAGRARAWIGGRQLTPPGSAGELAEAIRWVPRPRAQVLAREWSAATQQGRR